MNLVVSGELVDELGLPTIGWGTGAESASVSSERRSEDISVVLQLVGVARVTSDVIPEGGSILGRRAWHHTVIPIKSATIDQSD